MGDAAKTFLAEDNKALVGKLAGDKGEELSGEIISDITKPSDLKGKKLPEETPCYVLLKPAADRLCLISWLPEYSNVKLKMKCSTFKASVLDHVKTLFPEIGIIVQREVCDEDDFTDDLTEENKVSEAGYAVAVAPKPAATGGFKPPAGAFALPGMGPR